MLNPKTCSFCSYCALQYYKTMLPQIIPRKKITFSVNLYELSFVSLPKTVHFSSTIFNLEIKQTMLFTFSTKLPASRFAFYFILFLRWHIFPITVLLSKHFWTLPFVYYSPDKQITHAIRWASSDGQILYFNIKYMHNF